MTWIKGGTFWKATDGRRGKKEDWGTNRIEVDCIHTQKGHN
jgi:hypothetical protein